MRSFVIIEKTLEFLFPRSCLCCGRMGEAVCGDCKSKKLKIYKTSCHVCKERVSFYEGFVHEACKGKTNLEGVFVAYKYSPEIERIVSEVKYKGYHSISDQIAGLILQSVPKNLEIHSITAVPLHKRKQWKRGFNQAELFGRMISKKTQIPYKNCFSRIKNTKTQVGMSREERIANLKNAFQMNLFISNLESVLIVDDIMTTGTTLEQCANQLKRQNKKIKIYATVLARG